MNKPTSGLKRFIAFGGKNEVNHLYEGINLYGDWFGYVLLGMFLVGFFQAFFKDRNPPIG
jgi:uncharacterized membrane protein YraQ (UPF0718 family)